MKKSSSSLISFLLLLCLLFLSPLISVAQTPKCHPQDQKVIQEILASFGMNFTGDCCDSRLGVSCTFFPPYNRVTEFQIGGSNISGQIPAAIGDLSYLEFLEISSAPNLTGNIPTAITKLSKLTGLAITFTGISGPIPTFPLNLTNFTSLVLRNNALTGSIPSQLPSWFPNLKGLALENNKFTGTIPESLGNLSWLPTDFSTTLDLSNNSFTGPVPKSLGNLDPYYIDLSGNNFNGDASALFGINKTTQYLYLHGNHFAFDLSKVQFAPTLKEVKLGEGYIPRKFSPNDYRKNTWALDFFFFLFLSPDTKEWTAQMDCRGTVGGDNSGTLSFSVKLSYNNIFGSLPQQMTQLQFLTKLDVSHNMLCGEIPQGGLLQSFKINRYSHNKCLCGAPLPPCIK